MNWPFPDDPSTAVFTGKAVVHDCDWIHFASHDKEDGAWQFHSIDGVSQTESQSRVALLRRRFKVDFSVSEVADSPFGRMDGMVRHPGWHLEKA